jgi:outer membrane protein
MIAITVRLMMRAMMTMMTMVAFMLSSVVHAEEMKIGVVDLQRALNECDEGAAIKSQLKREIEGKQKDLDVKRTELEKMQADLQAQAAMMKDDVKMQKAQEFQRKAMEAQQVFMQMQQDFAKREQEATAGIFQKMGVILQTMAEERGYTAILERTAVPFAKPSLDITNELIQRYNDAHKSKKKKG